MKGLAAATLAAGLAHAGEPVRSGLDYMGPPLQAMQRDDSLNPGLLWVHEGAALWGQRSGRSGKSCADCHGPDPLRAMKGVAARYPAWDDASGGPVSLAGRIDRCRQQHQQATPQAENSDAALALAAVVAHASRGLPVMPPRDPRLEPIRAEGQRLWNLRIGQLDLACADCHERLVGRRLGGSTIPPGNGNGYPSYRLEWQTLGSLGRRIRNCMTGVRAQPEAPGSPVLLALEAYLAARDRGLPVETPAVRP